MRDVGQVRFVTDADAAADDVDALLPDDCGAEEFERAVRLLVRLAAARAELARSQAGEQRRARLAETDPLTQLANRRAWDDASAALLSDVATAERPLVLALIDLDDFKAVNDRHGHGTGDAVLKAFADGLRSAVRRGDVAARIGGDEFALLLPELAEDRAAAVIERIRRTTVDKLAAAKLPAVTCSVGYVNRSRATDDTASLVAAADEALHRAKQLGRDRIEAAAIRDRPEA
ncbi:MAG: GGDEF domain-containing protein [Pirellulales bacterium]